MRVILVKILLDLWQEFVLLSDKVFLREINQVNHGFGGDEQMFVEDLNIGLVPVTESQMLFILNHHLLDLGKNLVLVLEGLVVASHILSLNFIVDLLEVLNVLEPELLVDDVEVPDRVHVTLHVSDVWVLECTTQMEESVTSMWKNMMKKNVN